MNDIPLLILLFILNSLEIFGFYAATRFDWITIKSNGKKIFSYDNIEQDSKEILWFVKYYSEKWFGEKWSKPVCNCPICMGSLHSLPLWIIIYFNIFPNVIHFDFSFGLIFLHLNYIFWLCGLNKLITSLTFVDL